jgi:hypothetical protein
MAQNIFSSVLLLTKIFNHSNFLLKKQQFLRLLPVGMNLKGETNLIYSTGVFFCSAFDMRTRSYHSHHASDHHEAEGAADMQPVHGN